MLKAPNKQEHAGPSPLETVVEAIFRRSIAKCRRITTGHVLHDWHLNQKSMLIEKAYDALPEGGPFPVFEPLIDDARRQGAFGLLMSHNAD